MNGLLAEASLLAQSVREGSAGLACDMLICPPFTALTTVAAVLAGSEVQLGGQDCHMAETGAFTGDISAAMLHEIGARFVILGHSERRAFHAEIDEIVREKTVAALAGGLTPIVCVGETGDQRREGQAMETVGWQLECSLPKGFAGVVAYEPRWAIGTGVTPTKDEIAEMHGFIRAELVRQFGASGKATRILYGGSVKAANAAMVLSVPEVGGVLIGGASLVAAEFLAIARAAAPL